MAKAPVGSLVAKLPAATEAEQLLQLSSTQIGGRDSYVLSVTPAKSGSRARPWLEQGATAKTLVLDPRSSPGLSGERNAVVLSRYRTNPQSSFLGLARASAHLLSTAESFLSRGWPEQVRPRRL